MESRQYQYHHQETGMDEKMISTTCNGASGKAPCQNGMSSHHITSPDIIEKDSRNGSISADIHYPPSMHGIATKRPVFLLARSPVLDNEKDMTRTPTTPRSPPVPITASPTSSSSNDGKIAPGVGGVSAVGVLPRGAHLPSYHSTSSSTMSTTSSSSSEAGNNGGYVGGASGYGARPAQIRTQYSHPPTTSSGATVGHRLASHHYGGGGQGHQGMGGVGGGGMPHPSHMQSDPRYRMSGQYDTRYANRPSVAAVMYSQPAQAYSSYPSESYAPPYRANYSRPMSTGSLSSISTASSRPGFSSLDEFPTMYDHRSTFAPSTGEASQPRHRNNAGAPYTGGGGDSRHYPSHPCRQVHNYVSNTSGAYVEVTSPLSPSCDEHQPLLSLSLSEQQQQHHQSSSVVLCGESPSDELGGQSISEELSRKLNIQDPRATSHANRQPQLQSSMAAGGNFDEGASCILILEHPRDIEVLPNERAILRCTARISRRDQEQSQSKAERGEEEGQEEEPNLLWYKDAEPLIGEIDCEFVVEKATERDIGVYYCLVSHPTLEHIQRQSNIARLTIKKSQDGREPGAEASSDSSAPEIVEQPPKEVAAVISEKLMIPLKATGAQLSFRWYKDNKELRYADGPVLQIPSARYSDSGVYCCSISNKFGSVLSSNSLVKVTQVRDYSAQPQPGSKRPTSLYDWGDQPLSDAFLRDVGKAVAHQTTNLNRIALYLGLRNTDIVEINQHFRKPEEQAFHMLRLWSRGQGSRERKTLKIILTKAGIKLDLLTAGTSSRKPTVKPPKIAVHPKSTRVTYGHSLNLSIQADSSEPGFALQYQWYRNNKPLGGKTDPNIMISSATNGDAGEYFCVISNQLERTVSNVARVDIINPHTSTPAPLSSMAAASSAFINPSSSSAVPHPTYVKGHWGRGGGGGREGLNELPSDHRHQAPPTMGGDFLSRGGVKNQEVEWEDDPPSGQPLSGVGAWDRQPGDTEASEIAGSTFLLSQQQVSAAATASPQLKPQIVEHPQSQQVEAGDPLTLRCSVVGGTGQLSYTWYFNGLSLAGEDRPEYEINCFTDEDEGLYQCKVQSAHGEALSRMAHIQMKDDGSD